MKSGMNSARSVFNWDRWLLAGVLQFSILRTCRLEASGPSSVAWMSLLLAFSATPAFAQTPTNALSALIPAYGEIPPTFWELNATVVSIDVIVLLAVAVAVAWEIFRTKPAPVLPPEKIVRDALARRRSQPEDGKLLSEVSQILRRYVGAVFEFPGGEMTTAEFCTRISQHEKIAPELAQTISDFLRECDVRKFSPANSTVSLDAVQRAGRFVAQIQQQANLLKQGELKS